MLSLACDNQDRKEEILYFQDNFVTNLSILFTWNAPNRQKKGCYYIINGYVNERVQSMECLVYPDLFRALCATSVKNMWKSAANLTLTGVDCMLIFVI